MSSHRYARNKGRNTNWRGVALDEWLLASTAWRALSGDARALYIEFRRRYAPSRNGAIPFSIREMCSSINRTDKTASKALGELVEKGFVRARWRGSFHVKFRHATEWELTEYDVRSTPARKDFMQWQPAQKKPRS